MEENYKLAGENHHLHKKPKVHCGKFKFITKKTNTTSPAGSRPHPHIRRFFNKHEHNDIIRHNAVDFTTKETIYRKTACPRFVSLNYRKLNHQTNVENKKIKKENKIHIINLPQIYEKLWLSNFEFVNQQYHLDKKYDFKYIINLTGNKIVKGDKKIYYITLNDDRHLRYYQFVDVIKKTYDIILNAENEKEAILVHCGTGVNRSIAIVIAYAIMEKNMKLDDILRYIESKKKNIGVTWDSLTNMHFHHLLKQLEFDCT